MAYRHPLQRNGTSQVERWLKALEPQYVKIDDRSVQDLIVFTHEYARLIRYFGATNEPDGDWQSFWRSEPLLIYAITSALNTATYEADFLNLSKGYFKNRNTTNISQQLTDADLKKIIDLIYKVARKIEWVYDDLDDSIPLKSDIKLLISLDYRQDREQLQTALKELIGYDRGLSSEENPVNQYTCFINAHWGLAQQSDFDCILPNKYVTIEILQRLFKKFILALQKIKTLAGKYFDQEQTKNIAHQPHIALFITFLRLFEHARTSLNGLVEKQLDFYYEKVLCQHRRPHIPDSVHVIFELAKEFHQHQIDEGTFLSAGKDKINKELVYEIDDNWVFNQAKIKEVKTIHFTDYPVGETREKQKFQLTALSDAPSQDGNGKAFPNPDDARFRALGDENDPRMPGGDYGFLISSPQLLLEEGVRTITLTLETGNAFADASLFDNAFIIQVSNQDKWLAIDYDQKLGITPDAPKLKNYFFTPDTGNATGKLAFEIWLLPETPPVTTPSKIKNDRLAAELTNPAIRILLNNDITYTAHKAIREVTIKRITIDVNVVGVSKNLIVQNDSAVMDATKKFQPFTATPHIGSNFYIGSREVFQKKLDSLDVVIDWDGLPNSKEYPKGFDDYYTFYKGLFHNPDEVKFEFPVRIDYLDNSVFKTVQSKASLFGEIKEDRIPQYFFLKTLYPTIRLNPAVTGRRAEQTEANNVVTLRTFKLSNDTRKQLGDNLLESNKIITLEESQLAFPRQPVSSLKEYVQGTTQRGFIRLNLRQDFLHDKYAVAVVKYANLALDQQRETQPPNPPYTPTIKKIDINYRSTQTFEANYDGFYYLTPFKGYKKEEIALADASLTSTGINSFYQFQVGEIQGRGNLYIGLSDVNPQEAISLLFQVADGSEKNFDANPPEITWSYLAKNQQGEPNNWTTFQPYHILKDTTRGLQKSGILRLSLPDDITTGNTLLNPDLLWIRAAAEDSAETDIGALPDLVAVRIQAAVARFKNQTNELSHLATVLPKQQIKKLQVAQIPVKKVDQPYASFEGKLPETGNEFYRRVSERLRHKDRAVTIWDYEHLVLEQFPDIFRTKCLSHTRHTSTTSADDEFWPGNVLVAVVPQLNNRNAVNRAEPRVPQGRLRDVEDFLRARCSLFVGNEPVAEPAGSDCACVAHTRPHPQVINPHYEQILVSLCINFIPGDKRAFSFRLDDDIRQYLAPWINDERADIAFGRVLYRSKILEFIENLPYINVVGGFEVYLISDTAQPLTKGDILGDTSGDGGKNRYKVQGDSIRPTTARSILTTFSNPAKGPGDTHHELTAKDAAHEVCQCS